MRYVLSTIALLLVFSGSPAIAQDLDPVVEEIVREAEENSQLERLGHELMDKIGPRLVGTPQMDHAHEWGVETFEEWGINAWNHEWGEWRGWKRGITHIDMVSPRVVSLEGMQLAWSPPTPEGGVTGEAVILPDVDGPEEFQEWLEGVDGKFVLISMEQPTGRPDYNWEEYATDESFERMQQKRSEKQQAWQQRIQRTGHNSRSLPQALEQAGAAGVIISNWSQAWSTNKIFSAGTEQVPTVDLSLEDYGMLFRLAKNGEEPEIRLDARSEDRGMVPTFNTIAEIEGTEYPDEYVMLSAHFDSWEGATGATDNGTGTIAMMEAMRILKEVYPEPKRTIKVGLWGAEEQGLNGSRAFVEDHPEVVDNLQALFNQDNGTGRVVNISGQGFLHSYEFITRWLSGVPEQVRDHIDTNFPGMPSGGGTDHASFVAAGAPGINLSSLSWDYWNYTWHTNRDTYDKIVFDDVRNNVILIAALAYMASEDPEMMPRDKRVMPVHPQTGEPANWPSQRSPNRSGGQ